MRKEKDKSNIRQTENVIENLTNRKIYIAYQANKLHAEKRTDRIKKYALSHKNIFFSTQTNILYIIKFSVKCCIPKKV